MPLKTMNGKPGRKPIPNRDDVRTEHVTIKISSVERALLMELVEQRRAEREAHGEKGVYTVSAYVRELVRQDDVRRKRLGKKQQAC